MVCGLAAAGFGVEIMLRPDGPHLDILHRAAIPVYPLTLGKRLEVKGIRAIRERLLAGRFDVLHTLMNRPLSNGLMAVRGLPVRVVAYRGISGNLSRFNPGSWLTYLNPRIDRIACVCDAIREYLVGIGIPETRVVRIYKGHRVEWYAPAPRAQLGKFGIPPEALVVASAANMPPRKGMGVLLKAAETVSVGARPVHYLLMGAIKDDGIAAMRLPSALRERIHFTGFRRDAAQLTGACDVLVLPSLRREGLPKGVIEAMAQGIAPVVSNSGGSAELVRDGIDGWVVPPGDSGSLASALSRLLADASMRARMGSAARARIDQDFRIEQTVNEYARLYRFDG